MSDISKRKAESFLKHIDENKEGMSVKREKFIKDLNTGSPKVLPANKKDNY